MIEVEAPDGTVVEFPEGTTPDVMRSAMQKRWGAPQPAAQPAPQGLQPSIINDIAEGAYSAIPFSDEIVSGAMAPIRAAGNWVQGKGFDLGRSYQEGMDSEKQTRSEAEERSPVANTIGQVGGGLALGSPFAKGGMSLLQGAKPTLGSLIGRGTAEGAIYGGLYGAGEGQGIEERGYNALWGAGTGAGVGGALGGVARIGAKKVDTAGLPKADDLKSAAKAAYQRADDAGVVYSQDAVKRVRDQLVGEYAEFGYHPELHRGARVALDEVGRLADQPVGMTLKGMETARKIAGNAFEPGNASNNALTAKVSEAIDGLMTNPQAGDVLAGNSGIASEAMREARGLYSQARKLETLNELLVKAGRRAASTGSGGNIENTTRQELRKLLDSERKRRGFTKDELAAIERAVMGSGTQTVLRLIGKLSPEGNGLMTMLHLLAAGGSGGMTLPAAAVGMGAKRIAEGMTGQAAKMAEAIIASGGKPLPAPTLAPTRKAIVDALTRGSVPQLPGYIGQ